MRINALVYPRILLVLICALLTRGALPQVSEPRARITQPIVETNSIVLTGNTHPLARSKFDQGAAPSDLALDRMLLVLRRSPEQDAALKLLLEEQQDKSSSRYHAWVTPEAFAQQFGPDDSDIQTITSWLTSHGFKVNRIASGRGVIDFSGTAEQVKETFHTEIHKYNVHGEEHWANSADPQIPAALGPVVAGISTLHNFARKPLHQVVSRLTNRQAAPFNQLSASANPMWTSGGSGCGLAGGSCYGVTPFDLATIYNVLPLWNANSPIDGTGQTIAIVSRSDIYPQDFSNFRKTFGLPSGTLNIVYDGGPAGKLASQGDELEADLDVQTSGSLAKGATIDLVVSAATNTTDGVDLSALYIVDNNLAPILSESYGACELDMGATGNQFYNQLWQQAAAQGISVFVSTGDSGSAVCDQDIGIPTQGLAVNGIGSTPYNIAVGGTDFADFADASSYWNSTNDPVTHASAKGYVPESTWNDTCTNNEFFVFTGDTTAEGQCNDSSSNFWPGFLFPVGGSGGASNCTNPSGSSPSSCSGGYSKPSWQSGPGVTSDGSRDVPDVSLFAAAGLNSSFYFACETDIYGGCADGDVYSMVALGGTSASAPAFASIMALVDQKTQSRQGNANYHLYALAAQPGNSCVSTGSPGSSCIFYDITEGTIAMPCATGSRDCNTSNPIDLYGVLSGYATNAGYDHATGLGSVNVTNLVNNWNAVNFTPTTSTLSLSPTSIVHGAPVEVNVSVAPESGSGTPSGMVSLLTSSGQQAGTFALSNGEVSSTTTILPGGTYNVSAHYAGDGVYGASDSSPNIPVTVNPEPSAVSVQAFTLDQNGNRIPFTGGPYGGAIVFVGASVAGKSGQGVPSGSVTITQTVGGATTNVPGDPLALNVQGLTFLPYPGYNYWAYAPGMYTMAARYNGDPSFQKSAPSSLTFTITQAQSNVTMSVSGCSSASGGCTFNPGGFLDIFASVNYSGGAFNTGGVFINQPTGTMTFYSNGVALGAAVPIDSSIIPPVANIGITQLPPGVSNITAQYSGDTDFLGSMSAPFVVDVGQTFAIAANPATINISSPGQSGSTTLTFTPKNGFTGSTALSPAMCSNLPPKSSCTFNPATVTFGSGTTNVPVTLTITTTAPNSNSALLQRFPGPSRILSIGIGIFFPVGICIGFTGRKASRKMFAAFLALALTVSTISCGGGNGVGGSGGGGGGTGGGGGGDNSNQGTPVGTYNGVTVTVTINGVTQSINNLSIDVQ